MNECCNEPNRTEDTKDALRSKALTSGGALASISFPNAFAKETQVSFGLVLGENYNATSNGNGRGGDNNVFILAWIGSTGPVKVYFGVGDFHTAAELMQRASSYQVKKIDWRYTAAARKPPICPDPRFCIASILMAINGARQLHLLTQILESTTTAASVQH